MGVAPTQWRFQTALVLNSTDKRGQDPSTAQGSNPTSGLAIHWNRKQSNGPKISCDELPVFIPVEQKRVVDNICEAGVMQFKKPSIVSVAILGICLGAIFFGFRVHHANGIWTESNGLAVDDQGLFVVANSYSTNGTSVPRDLVAGHWGELVNTTVLDNSEHLMNFRLFKGKGVVGILIFSVNSTLTKSTLIHLDMGTSELPGTFYLELRWT